MWKKILSILLMLCMVLTTFPANALTEELEEPRPCLINGGMPNGERFFRQSRRIFAGGLTPGKKIQRRVAGKGPSFGRFDIFQTWPNQTVSDNESLLKEGGDNFFAGGNGTEENPFQIANAEQLDAMRKNLSAHYELISNIDLSSFQSWTPIGTADSPFAGTLNGNGYKIGGLTIDEKSIDAWVAANTGDIQQVSLGLFGEVDYNFKCSDISFENYSVNIGESLYPICCGAVVGRIFDKTKIVVSGITVSGTVEILNKKDYGVTVGGIIGNANLCSIDIYDCVNNADIWANGSSAICAGIVGYINNATIKTSDNTGTIIGISQGSTGTVGGIAGFATYSSILECNNRGNVESTVSKFNVYLSDGMNCMVGGIAGETGTTIKDCDNYGDVTAIMLVGGSSAAGGICGYQSNYSTGNTENCTNYGGRITATYGVLVDKDKDIWENRDGFAGRVCGAGINLSNNFSIDSALVNGKFPTDHIGASEINGASISTGPDDTNTFTEVHQLKSWDVFTNTVYFHDGTSYLRVSEDAVNLNSLLNYWVTCTLRNSDTGVLLVSMEKLETKTETVIKTLKAYDVFTNTVYFADDTSYPLGENVSIDLDSLLNKQVICTIDSNPAEGVHITSIIHGAFDEETLTLTIRGSGPMRDFSPENRPPWYDHRDEIGTVVFESGITRIGNHAINGYPNIRSIYLRGGPPEFGAFAFAGLLQAVAVYPAIIPTRAKVVRISTIYAPAI